MIKPLFRRQSFRSPDATIARLNRKGIPYMIRKGSECTEILLGDTLIVFTSIANFPRNKLFLFKSVKTDVKKFIERVGTVHLPNEFPVTKFNTDYPYDRSIGIDVNHAYWRIAYIKGIISEKTYNNGLSEDCKALRLATLSVLGREKKFVPVNIEGGTEDVVQVLDPEHLKIFRYIRLVCYDMMNTIAKKLGNDFDCWKTDCIYFHDTPENRKIIIDYFERKKMTYKILDYFDDGK